jgi:phosphoglycolate phosphatase-like HAD superfamily hydrolase
MLETLSPVIRVGIFDFDGTVSLIRSGWFQIMTDMMIETLAGLNGGESESELRRSVEDSIWRLTGKDTIYQMMALADHVKIRGGNPLDTAVYMEDFQARLAAVTGPRIRALQTGACSPDCYLIPGTRNFLEALRARGLRLYLASGTLETCVKQECDLLDITRYFDGGIYGAREDYTSFSKRMLIENILAEPGMEGAHLVGFGDGPVEIEEVRRGGGMAVGVAPLEPECRVIDPWKRDRLRAAGAQTIIPNYLSPAPRYETFDRSRLLVKPLAERAHDLQLNHWLPLDAATPLFEHADLAAVAARLREARTTHAARILMMGAHVLRAGVNRHIIDLIERGFIDHLAMNGAGAIHDYELARIGATTESVDRYIRTGEFGLWRETGELNDWIREAADLSLGLGENIGRRIQASDFPHRDLSLFAAAYRAGVPVTVHPGIGYDIIHQHPNCDGAALGASGYHDFLIFARSVERLEGGVLLNFGSAIMGPEVYLKALAMARNVARQDGREIRRFTTAVFDLIPIHGDPRRELPKTDPGYYFRPHKTILVRTVADGGESFYFAGDHRATLPALRRVLVEPA